jgi:NTE family protein
MRSANNYCEWQAAAIAHDKHTGAAAWRARERSSRYDYRVIRHRLNELKKLRCGRNPTHLLFYLREGVHGNMGGIGESALYRRAKFGTKDLITEYINETVAALDQIA